MTGTEIFSANRVRRFYLPDGSGEGVVLNPIFGSSGGVTTMLMTESNQHIKTMTSKQEIDETVVTLTEQGYREFLVE